jgi:adenosylhomocysteine nucleosidase
MFAPEPACGMKAPPVPRRAEAGKPLVVTALREEFEAIASRVSRADRRRVGKGRPGILLRGKMDGASVLLGMTGDGEVRAEGGLSSLLGEFRISLLLGAGVAGALVSSLRRGDVVVSERIFDGAGEAPAPDPTLVAKAVSLGARAATFVTVARPLTSPKEKKEHAARVGASDSALAVVDMESAAWGRAAASRGVPFVILRAVSDTLDEDLPGFLSSCLSREGSLDRAAIARRLLRHPEALPALLAMRRRVVAASEGLGRFLVPLLSASS